MEALGVVLAIRALADVGLASGADGCARVPAMPPPGDSLRPPIPTGLPARPERCSMEASRGDRQEWTHRCSSRR